MSVLDLISLFLYSLYQGRVMGGLYDPIYVPFLYFCTHLTNYHTILYVDVMSFVFGTESYLPIYYDNFSNFLSFLMIF